MTCAPPNCWARQNAPEISKAFPSQRRAGNAVGVAVPSGSAMLRVAIESSQRFVRAVEGRCSMALLLSMESGVGDRNPHNALQSSVIPSSVRMPHQGPSEKYGLHEEESLLVYGCGIM